ncbi:MAG: HEPN domain-containing protein [Candidatus Cloacimonadales bacterium]|nr:HEPN domain-containing protein [Candidatus Cloacimonadales bacterium]
MKSETRTWLSFAIENLESSKILLASQLYNPCLQNVQQSVEKALKAILVEKKLKITKTHNILELKYLLESSNIRVILSDDECDFLNTIYLPSKYPIGSALPDFDPDETICRDAVEIAERIVNSVKTLLL